MANSLNRNNNTNSYIGVQSKVKSIPSIAEIDRVNIYEFENGMDLELTNLGGEITSENIKKAQAKVLKNLKKDPAYYTNQLAEESVKLVGAYGSGKKPGNKTKEDAEKVKAEVTGPKDETPKKDKDNELKTVGKIEKANVSKDKKPTNPNTIAKAKQETYTAKKAKGIKSTMDLPGKEKKINLKENKEYQGISDEQKTKLEKTVEYLKQQGKNEMAAALERLMKSGIKDLDEKLRKNAPVSKYVSDFEKSDAPQFKGKSSKERRNMAVAAYAEKNPGKLKEETSSYPMPMEWVKQYYDVTKGPEGIKIIDKFTDKEVSLYDVGEHWEKFKAQSTESDMSDADVTSSLKRQVSQPIRSFDTIVKGLTKEGKIKLTKENINMIQEMVVEAVAMVKSKSGTDAIDYKNPQELNTLRTDPNITSIKTTTGQKIK
jgi:hypothetical protein